LLRFHLPRRTWMILGAGVMLFHGVAGPSGAARASESDPQAAAAPVEEPLWPGGVKDKTAGLYPEPEKVVDRAAGTRFPADRVASNVSEPTITVFRAPREQANGVAVAILPGGGYRTVGIDFGHLVARGLSERGTTAAFVKYRTLPVDRDGRIIESVRDMAFQAIVADGMQAVRLLRSRAAQMDADPKTIGVVGLSAGGHLALSAMLKADESCRPDFACLVYPGVDDAMLAQVKKGLCPVFIVMAADDKVVDPKGPLALFAALRKAGVPVELHLFQSGGHGFGLGRTNGTKEWPGLFDAWLYDNIPAERLRAD
jgi:acetyl esterase/lipase